MRQLTRFAVLGVAVAFLMLGIASSVADAAPDKRPTLHRWQYGKKVKGLQWLLSGHRLHNRGIKIVAYRGPLNSYYDKPTAKSVHNMKWRLGYPHYALNGNVAGAAFVGYLKGTATRSRSYFQRATTRLAYLEKIKARRAKSGCAIKVIQLAQHEVGVHEYPDGSNSGTRVREYESTTGAYGAPWCVSFVQWVFKHARVSSPKAWSGSIADNSAGAFYVAGWARSHGWLRAVPRPAYIVVFMDHLGHVGVVKSVTTHGFTSIEGNASNGVLERFHPFGARPEVFVRVPGCATG